ncbi:MAG TPA: hypothetical protein PL196_05600 [Burkholderiaceae bacterium]|nr:hypothetical protein [Burkholderiaceae bacterium]
MISRLTIATAFAAILAAASIAFAADLRGTQAAASPSAQEVVQLERVIVTAQRLPAESR